MLREAQQGRKDTMLSNDKSLEMASRKFHFVFLIIYVYFSTKFFSVKTYDRLSRNLFL